MMILRSSPPSPFGRKVKLALGILGLANEVTIEKADVTDPADSIRVQNPRFKALTLQAMCDGILDTCILLVYEGRWRPAEKHEPKWIEHQDGKVKRAFAVLEAAPPVIGATPNVGQITLACALGYGDLRFGGTWRKEYPRLVAWLDDFAARVPAFAATRVTP